mgnify:CR=1 FL=1
MLHAREAAAGVKEQDPELTRLQQLFTGPQAAEATAQVCTVWLGEGPA